MNTRILIIENEFPIALDLQTRLEKMGYEVVGIGANYQQGLSHLAEENYDIVLCDINLEEKKSGIDLGVIVLEKFHRPVIFITAYADEKTFADALRAQPMGYITKPFDDIELNRSILIALNCYDGENKVDNPGSEINNKEMDYFFVKDKGIVRRIAYEELLWVEAMDNYSIIHTLTGKYIVNLFLKDVLNKLGDRFVRIHRSHAVALNKINSIDDNILYIGEISLVISNHYKLDLLKRMNIL